MAHILRQMLPRDFISGWGGLRVLIRTVPTLQHGDDLTRAADGRDGHELVVGYGEVGVWKGGREVVSQSRGLRTQRTMTRHYGGYGNW